MKTDRHDLEPQLLDLIVDGPDSFAGLYRGLVVHKNYPRYIDLGYLLDILLKMERAGLVRSTVGYDEDGVRRWSELNEGDRQRLLREYQEWLPNAEFQEMSFDEIGVWFEILEPGRDVWRSWMRSLGKEPERRDWQVYLDLVAKEATVYAPDEHRAREVLLSTCSLKKVKPIEESFIIETVDQYTLRSGHRLEGGVKLRCRLIV